MSRNPRKVSWWSRHPRLLGVGLPAGAVALAVGLAWWVSRPTGSAPVVRLPGMPSNLGPAAVLCGTSIVPRDPPPIDSPFGMHLFASTPRGPVHALPAMSIADTLMPPATTAAPAAATAGKAAPPAAAVNAVQAGGAAPAPLARNETALDDVEAVGQILEEYRRAFGAMPVGELNDEIVRRLQGENPLGIAVLPKSHPAINAQGELVDRWGTPYRFHPESFWLMTVRSAGPDKRMWSGDDILSTMQEGLTGIEGSQ